MTLDRRALVPLVACGALLAAFCSPDPIFRPAPLATPMCASGVGTPQPMISFAANPSTITEGDSFTLGWSAPCGYVSLAQKGQDPFLLNQPSTGSYQLRAGSAGYPASSGDTVYEAANGDVAQRLRVTVTMNPRVTRAR